MEMVQSTLNLDQVPTTIEGMDISALHGKMAVGTVVAFVEGEPHRRAYRNYRIRAVEGVDDYGMMTELVERRVGRGDLPDLFLVDGGKGHLSVVQKVLAREKERPAAKKGPFWGKPGGSRLPSVIAIAKPDNDRGERLEKLYVPGRKNAIRLRADHPVLLLMMRIRDEAHRRAVSYHRRLRKRRLTSSELDRIPGIGTQRKRTLLTNMGDITRIADASVEELARVPGINRKLAADIVSYFRGL
jgi:excinuclease ABC subunit C